MPTPDGDAPAPAEPAVLLLAPTGRDAALSADALRHGAVPCVVCPDADTLLAGIRRGEGPAFVASEALGPGPAAALEQILADQPVWSDAPLIIVAGRWTAPPHLRALVARRNTTLLYRPLKTATLVTAARSALEDRLRQYQTRDLLDRLEQRNRQLQRLALQLTQSEEAERQRLAQLLHDDLQQILVGATFQLPLLSTLAQKGRLEEAVDSLSTILDEAIETSRGLSHELCPPVLRQHGLPAALEWLARRVEQMHHLRVNLDVDPQADPDDGRIATFVYRGAQELLFNVVKHAGVDDADLHLALDGDDVVLRVRDRGRGIDPAQLDDDGDGMGLLSIRERADLLGGRFDIESNGASTFTLTMPLTRPDGAAGAPKDAATPAPPEPSQRRPALRIVLADDHRIMRSGLRSLLEDEEDLEVVAEADDGVAAVALAGRLEPDVVLMDVSMPEMDGVEATRQIKQDHPAIRVIGLSMFEDEPSARKMREAGAERYLTKTGPTKDLLAAIRLAGRT
ncbi:MAG: response regulator [Planctomycetota bacterium]